MSTTLLTACFAIASVFSAPFLKNVFDMRREKNYREMVGSIVWPAVFFGAASMFLAMEGDIPIKYQNVLLGVFGALLGASILIWGGYFVRDNWGTQAQSTQTMEAPAMTEKKVGDESVVIGDVKHSVGNKSVVIGPTDNHGNTILNQGPLAVGHGAQAGPGSIAIGTNAGAGLKKKE